MGLTFSQSLFDAAPPPPVEERAFTPSGPSVRDRGCIHRTPVTHSYKPHMTLYTNLMERRLVDDGSRPIFGTRKIDPVTKVAGDYEWVTYNDFLEQVEHVSAAMVHELGLTRQEPVGVFSKNRYEWVLVEHGTSRMSYQLVPLYDTLGPKAIPFILNQTEMRVIFCGKQQFNALFACLDKCPSVKIVVQFEDVDDEQRKVAATKNIELKSLAEIMEVGKSKPVEADPPLPEDICTICYTSGTTGDPKGAMLTHANLASASIAPEALNNVFADDSHLSYLPLAHVLERVIQTLFIFRGARVGFYQGDPLKLLDDMVAMQPTVLVAVPRVLNRIHDRIQLGLAKTEGWRKTLFDHAYAVKREGFVDGYVHHALWDAVAFAKLRGLLGGRVRAIMTGAAPITAECKEFLQIVFGCTLIEGYGMTETCGVISISNPQHRSGAHVGVPVPEMEIRLSDVPDMHYTSDDVPCPRGEICVRGANVFRGYYKDPAKTQELFDADGWLHTGDIGQWNPDGTLSIIDRKKNIFKLAQGEYVAPEKIENLMIKSPLVGQIYVHGDSLQSYLVGVVVPDAEAVQAWAQGTGATEQTLQELCGSDALRRAILAELDALAQTYGLCGFERVRKLHLHPEPWTPESNLVTPTFKLKRPQLVEYFAGELGALYAEDETTKKNNSEAPAAHAG